MMEKIELLLRSVATLSFEQCSRFFKTGPGEYAEHDRFIGVTVPRLRKIAKDFSDLSPHNLQELIGSPFNELRLLALIILVNRYKKGAAQDKEALYAFYLDNLSSVNNWNLVDASAHLIMGAHMIDKDRGPLLILAKSPILWEKRIAIVSTWAFIKQNDLEWTFKLALVLLNDPHDLMHKAVGWMLREAGKRCESQLKDFLMQNAPKMPRTMLRYSIEKFDADQRKGLLKL